MLHSEVKEPWSNVQGSFFCGSDGDRTRYRCWSQAVTGQSISAQHELPANSIDGKHRRPLSPPLSRSKGRKTITVAAVGFTCSAPQRRTALLGR